MTHKALKSRFKQASENRRAAGKMLAGAALLFSGCQKTLIGRKEEPDHIKFAPGKKYPKIIHNKDGTKSFEEFKEYENPFGDTGLKVTVEDLIVFGLAAAIVLLSRKNLLKRDKKKGDGAGG